MVFNTTERKWGISESNGICTKYDRRQNGDVTGTKDPPGILPYDDLTLMPVKKHHAVRYQIILYNLFFNKKSKQVMYQSLLCSSCFVFHCYKAAINKYENTKILI